MRRIIPICVLGFALVSASAAQAADANKRVNVVFIILDQLRWDALGCAGNKVVKTPNIDRLAAGGVRFSNAYSSCPVCSPARTTILTGQSIATHKVTGNEEIRREDLPDFISFDQILLRDGYSGEYHGKYHSPYKLALDYTHPVRWLNGKNRPPNSKADMSESEAFRAYIEANVPSRPLQQGELLANLYQRPYSPDPIDGAYGMTQQDVNKLGRKQAKREEAIGQATTYGYLSVPREHTLTAWTAREGLAALGRLKGGPFTLTVSIGPPHPPMVVAKPFYGMYPPETIPLPASLDDKRINSPYFARFNGEPNPYRDPKKIQHMISDYYGLITEADEWVGKILDRLDEMGVAGNTLVIFTADHGEMLGDHGMHSKMVFYEGSCHIPLIMRLPGVIPAGALVRAPVAQIDLFSTILDYCNEPGHESQGHDLRPLIDGKEDGAGRVAVSEWNSTHVPGFMLFDGRYKLMFAQAADAPSLDALYDLQTDPQELNNLIGRNPDLENSRAEAERMKDLLVAWLTKTKSPYLEGVKARPIQKAKK